MENHQRSCDRLTSLAALAKPGVLRDIVLCVAGFFAVSMIADANIPSDSRGISNPAYREPIQPDASELVPQQTSHAPLPIDEPEEMLLGVYRALQQDSLDEAIARADALVERFPKFALGHFIHGDLQLMRSAPIEDFGAAAQGNDKAIADLREEAIVRLAALTERPSPHLVPKSVLQLSDDQKHALVVDTSRSRMFLYRHANQRLELVRDFYISQGKMGANKALQGDNKTPIGIYEITKRYNANQLSSFYGAGALPINYPNAWDTTQQRTGYGIWLHGVPPEVYNRPPKSSAGCVVLTNAEMAELSEIVDIGKTPVIISEREEFISEQEQTRLRSKALTLLQQWQADAEGRGHHPLERHYSANFKTLDGTPLDNWVQKSHRTLTANVPFDVSDVQAFNYPGEKEMLTIAFTRTIVAGAETKASRIQQYWALEGDQWRIVSETKTDKS